MFPLLTELFDLIFPRRENDAAIAGLSPEDFFAARPRWESNEEIYPGMRAIFRYQDAGVQAMIKELKSSRNKHAARMAAYAIERCFANDIRDAILVPMPISKKRREKRGYNQCELILDFLKTGNSGIEIRSDLLERPVDTAKFALAGRTERLKAAVGIFRATRILTAIERRIIVIDDVVTTGSTMHSALETLRKAGAMDVRGVGIAH